MLHPDRAAPLATDVLLVLPPTNPDGLVEDYDPREPLGLLYIASMLRRHGHGVRILQADMLGMCVQDTVNYVCELKPSVLGLSVVQRTIPAAKAIVEGVHRSIGTRVRIVVGGHQATLTPRTFLNDMEGVDAVVIGEGEATTVELVASMASGTSLENVRGVYCRSGDEVVETLPREKISDLDTIPFPARDLLPQVLDQTGYASVVTSRGCYGNCSFCGIRAFQTRSPGPCWRGRSPQNIAEELEYLVREFGVTRIRFNDDQLFGPGPDGVDRVLALCEEIHRRRLRVRLMGYCRASDVRKDLFVCLKGAGFDHFLIGIESFSDPILRKFRKGTSVDENMRAIRVLNELQLSFTPGFMPFTPYTSVDSLDTDLSHLRAHGLSSVTLSKALTIHQGTPIQRDVAAMGKLVRENPIHGYDRYLVERPVSKIYYISKLVHIVWIGPIRRWAFDLLGEGHSGTPVRNAYDSLRKSVWMAEASFLQGIIRLAREKPTGTSPNEEVENILCQLEDKLCTEVAHLSQVSNEISANRVNPMVTDREDLVRMVTSVLHSAHCEPITEYYMWTENDILDIVRLFASKSDVTSC